MPSLADAARDYGFFGLDDERLTVVHLLLYGPNNGAPTVEDASAWAKHYGLENKPNHVVLVGDERMQGPATFAMVPGLQLVDSSFVLRYDAAGRGSKDDLWRTLLPKVRSVMSE